MRKIFLTAAATLIAAPLSAQGTGGTVLDQYGSYTSAGQCNSALAHVRNAQRKNASTRGAGYQNLSGSAFNRASLTTTRCENVDGMYQIVYYQNGFPDATDDDSDSD
jgi:hypothetical protein